MTTYSAELAKSSRASCKRCKEKIEKDTLRIGVHSQSADGIEFSSWTHLACFRPPKKISTDDFLQQLNMPELSEEVQNQVRAAFQHPAPSTAGAGAGAATDGGALQSPASGKKRASGAAADGGGTGTKKSRLETELEGVPEEQHELFRKYYALTIDELKDYMRWNNQTLGGTKGELVRRCVDGEAHGALPPCPESGCKGKLKCEDGRKVTCSGAFSEEVGAFVRCYFSAPAESVTRLPWRSGPMSEDERKASLQFQSKVEASSADDGLFDGLDLAAPLGKKQAAERLLALAKERGINLPAAEQEAKVRVGSVVVNNPDTAPSALLRLLEQTFGTKASAAAKSEGSKMGTARPENAGIVAALSELSELYFKGGNSNAGNTYRKAAAAVRSLPSVITSGASLCRGKGKVDGIGQKCGELIDEFLETGAIAKIAEKRAELA